MMQIATNLWNNLTKTTNLNQKIEIFIREGY